MLRRGLGEEAVGYSSFFKAKRLLDFCVIPRQRYDLYNRISVSGLGSLRLGGCWPFAAPTIVEAAETQPPDGLVFPGKVS